MMFELSGEFSRAVGYRLRLACRAVRESVGQNHYKSRATTRSVRQSSFYLEKCLCFVAFRKIHTGSREVTPARQ